MIEVLEADQPVVFSRRPDLQVVDLDPTLLDGGTLPFPIKYIKVSRFNLWVLQKSLSEIVSNVSPDGDIILYE